MTTTYNLVPIPRWTFNDKNGKPLIGGMMYTFDNNNRSQTKPVYSEPTGTFAYTQPVTFASDGGQGPFYWSSDGAYFIQIFDSYGNPQFSIENFQGGSGGGGNITVLQSLTNYIDNGQFQYNMGNTATPIPGLTTLLAPSGIAPLMFLNADSSSYIGAGIYLYKSNLNVTDQIQFNNFSLGDTSCEANPIQYLEYVCTEVGSGGETFKYIQFPIKYARSLEGTQVTISFAGSSSSTSTVEVSYKQNFGTGGTPSAEIITDIAAQALTSSFARYNFTTTIPSTGGSTLGTNGDDYGALLIKLPLNTVCEINLVNIQIVNGPNPVPYVYETPNDVATTVFGFRTGDVKTSFQLFELGWVAMNDGTIGNASSGASTRANADTFSLFALLWHNVSNTYAPVSGGRGANAGSDFAANKTMTLPAVLGRALSCFGTGSAPYATNHPIGSSAGAEEHLLSIAEMPAHNHPGSNIFATSNNTGSPTYVGGLGDVQNTYAVNVATQGGGSAHSILSPSTYMNFLIKL